MGDTVVGPIAEATSIDRRIHDLLHLIDRPWTYHILMALNYGGPTRFSALQKKIPGISQRLLAQRLHQLELKGMVTRSTGTLMSRPVVYSVTVRSKDLNPVWAALREILQRWRKEDREIASYQRARSPLHGSQF